MSNSGHPTVNGGKDRLKHKGKKPKLTFDELLAKYLKDNEAKRASRSNYVKSTKTPPKHNSKGWSWQKKESYSATSYSSFEPSTPASYAPHSTSFRPYLSCGWNDLWTHTPSYFRPYHVEYAAPRKPMYARQSHIVNDRFESKNRSRVHEKKKVVKQVYRVKRDGRRDASSDLNSISIKPINVLETSAIDGKANKNSIVDNLSAKSERKKLKEFKNKEEVSLFRVETHSNNRHKSLNWQKKKLQKLSAQKLKEKGMAWVPKGSIQTQDKDDVQTKGATHLKEKKGYERRPSKIRFAPNHQKYWSLHHPFALQMPHMPMFMNSSINMFGYPSYYYCPWTPFESLYHEGFSPNICPY